MQFYNIPYAITLLTLFTNSVSAIEAEDIKSTLSIPCPYGKDYRCLIEPMAGTHFARYINFSTEPASRAFDYDPSLLPEVAEVIFALRIKHANIGERFILNLSGHYLLEFTNKKIDILDMYTKNSNIYEYQSTDPNITIGLGVSKGLSSDYKSIMIKEDANGKLYNYAALHSYNISTDETMLSETLSHPFYQITEKDGVEVTVSIRNAAVFYHTVPSHARHARCVKESKSVFEQLKDILGSGSGVCGPKGEPDLRIASHQSVKNMKLDKQLVEADIRSKYPDALGYREELRLDLNGLNAVAFLVSSLYCKVHIKDRLKSKRYRRAPTSGDCLKWSTQLIDLFKSLRLNYNFTREIVQGILSGRGIASSYFFDDASSKEQDLVTFVALVQQHRDKAESVLVRAAARTAQASANYLNSLFGGGVSEGATGVSEGATGVSEGATGVSEGATGVSEGATGVSEGATGVSDEGIQQLVAAGNPIAYRLIKKDFRPLLNIVQQVRLIHVPEGDTLNHTNKLELQVLNGEEYKTKIFIPNYFQRDNGAVEHYAEVIQTWMRRIEGMIKNITDNNEEKIILNQRHLTLGCIYTMLVESDLNRVISAIYHDNTIIGFSIGYIDNRVYYPWLSIMAPESIFYTEGAYLGAVSFLRSEVIRYLFSNGFIDSAETTFISIHNDHSPLNLDLKKHKKPKHDEL